MKIERQLQGTLNTVFTELIKERGLENKLSAYTTQEEGRADLMLKKASGKPLFFIELKDPTAKDGKTIFNNDIIVRETIRAQDLNIEYFGICNFISATFIKVTKLRERVAFVEGMFTLNDLARLRNDYNPSYSDLQKKFRQIANYYIDRALELLENKPIQFASPDELYIFKIRKLIEAYSNDVTYKVYEKLEHDNNFKKQINAFAEKQQWNAPQNIDEVEKLVHISLLVLVSKLIFYKTYYDCNSTDTKLSQLIIDNDIILPEALEVQLWEYFEEFKVVTKNFETLIGERSDIIAKMPFVSNSSVDLVKEVIQTGKDYDFSAIPYDIIGRIFEELIREDERHKLGQYFTPPLVIDFINAFCIHDKNATVLDPSCGSGTFLIRAYQRKKELGETIHFKLLENIYGCDISNYPAYLATLNLAIRNMKRASYPRVLHKDFFKFLKNQKEKFHLPNGTIKKQYPPFFDAIVGNPPYTRQEDIDAFMQGTKNNIRFTIKEEWKLIDNTQRIEPTQRMSIYGYFFYHAAALLKEGGYMGFIISNSWLNVDYGKDMQKFILRNFEIVALIETDVERFFPSADVNTNIIILRKQKEVEKRENNRAAFVYLKEKLADITNKYKKIDELIQYIISLPSKETLIKENKEMKIQYVPQKELKVNRWSLYFKAPDVYWEIIANNEDKFIPLKTIASIKRGFTTGCNEFFYGEDITNELTEKNISAIINNIDGLSLAEIKSNHDLVVFKNGFDELWLIETDFISPIIISAREIKNYAMKFSEVSNCALCVDLLPDYIREEDDENSNKRSKYDIKKYRADIEKNYPYLLSYIEYGERDNGNGIIIANKSTLTSRSAWWDLNSGDIGDLAYPYIMGAIHKIPVNGVALVDNNLFNIYCHNKDEIDYLGGILNSYIFRLFIELTGRDMTGALTVKKVQVYELEELLIPYNEINKEEIIANFNLLKNEKPLTIFDELNAKTIDELDLSKVLPLRKKLDESILKALGFEEENERNNILIDVYKSIILIIGGRLSKSKSLDSTRQKRNQIEFSVYDEALKKVLAKEAINVENTIEYGRKIKEIIKSITQEVKLQDKLLQTYWKATFGEKYDEVIIKKREQADLF